MYQKDLFHLPFQIQAMSHDSFSVDGLMQLHAIGVTEVIIAFRDVYGKEADDKSIDCFYHVHGERKDVNPVLVEYEGNSRYDYPDPNLNEESGMALEDRNFRDPNYLYPRNTITS